MSGENEPTHAVVLSGGGTSGAYGVGVLKALLGGLSPSTGKTSVAPRIFAGTSIGAYNAAFLVSRWDMDGPTAAGDLEQAWLEKLAENPPRFGEQEPSDGELRDFVKVVSAIAERAERRLPYRPMTIHRFHPRDDLAGGSLGMLNLDRGHIEDLIARGFSDARTHDCEAAGCVQRDGSGTRPDTERGSPR